MKDSFNTQFINFIKHLDELSHSIYKINKNQYGQEPFITFEVVIKLIVPVKLKYGCVKITKGNNKPYRMQIGEKYHKKYHKKYQKYYYKLKKITDKKIKNMIQIR
jgi:hypothetical protein